MRVDHVGSLLRPQPLKDAFRRFAASEIFMKDLRAAEDAAIREVVRRQEAIELPVVTDGEYRRLNWQVSFSQVEGWDMWRTSWDNFRRNPDNRAPGEKPLTKGEDAVVSFRIHDAARFVPLEQLALSPQCGFASGIAGNLLTDDEQWRKLEVMLETARQVWL